MEKEKNLKMATISKEYWYVNTLAQNMILKSLLIYEAKGIASILDLWQREESRGKTVMKSLLGSGFAASMNTVK